MSGLGVAALEYLASPFHRPLNDEALAKDRRYVDPVLSLVLLGAVFVYGVYEGMNAWDDQAFSAVCYSSKTSLPGGEKALKVKHLCYSEEVDEAWQSFALKTSTCRGEFGGTWWGVVLTHGGAPAANDPNNQPGNNQPGNNPNQPGNGPNQPGNNPPANPPPNNNNPGGRRLAAGATFYQPHEQPYFCSLVISQGDDELAQFVSQSMHDSCHGGGCHGNVDTSVAYSTATGSDTEKYYKINAPQEDGLTCCGMRYQSSSERLLTFLGALGGFYGLAHAVLLLVPPNTSRAARAKPKAAVEDEDNSGGWAASAADA